MSLFVLIKCVVYTVAGMSAFVAFLYLGYYAAAVFGICTAAISAVTAHINYLHRTSALNLWYEHAELDQLFWVGYWTFAIGTSGLVYHAVSLIILQELLINYVTAAIWGLIMLQSGAMLMYYANKYWRRFDTSLGLVVNDE